MDSPATADDAPDDLVDGCGRVVVAGIDRFEEEPGPRGPFVANAEDDHAAHQVLRTVATGAAHLPLRPDDVAVDHAGDHRGADVRDGSEDLFPVGSHLGPAVEAAPRMDGCVVAVVVGEAVDERHRGRGRSSRLADVRPSSLAAVVTVIQLSL